jgi:hypothetical protein
MFSPPEYAEKHSGIAEFLNEFQLTAEHRIVSRKYRQAGTKPRFHSKYEMSLTGKPHSDLLNS